MTDEIFFLSAKIKEFHFYRLIVKMSFGMVFDVEASGSPLMGQAIVAYHGLCLHVKSFIRHL
jgi:hypothetical protein